MTFVTSYQEIDLRGIGEKIHRNLLYYSNNHNADDTFTDVNEKYDSDTFFNTSSKIREFYKTVLSRS